MGNNADLDDDGDGVADDADAFPLDATESLDSDNDGIGNNTDDDDDNDGVTDALDAFPLDSSESQDTDGDGIGNNADPDDDGDGVSDESDAFPLDPSETTDTQMVTALVIPLMRMMTVMVSLTSLTYSRWIHRNPLTPTRTV